MIYRMLICGMVGILPMFASLLAKCTGSPASRADPRLEATYRRLQGLCACFARKIQEINGNKNFKEILRAYDKHVLSCKSTACFGIFAPVQTVQNSQTQLFFLHRLDRRACIMAITICLGRAGSCESEHWRNTAITAGEDSGNKFAS